MDFLPLVAAVLILAAWLRWEHAHARPKRIATHTYYAGKKTRTRISAPTLTPDAPETGAQPTTPKRQR